MASVDPLSYDPLFLVHFDIGLSNDVFILLPGGQVKDMGLVFGRLLPSRHLFVHGSHLGLLVDFPDLEAGASPIDDLHVVHNNAVDNSAVGRLDKSKVVDLRIAAQGGDQADIGPFRGLNGADAPIVGGMNIPHFKSGSLSAQSPRAQC